MMHQMKKAIVFIASLALCVSALAQQIREQNPADHNPRVFPMPIKHLVAHSDILGVDKNFSVILPKSYETQPDRYYPVVYMLHGGGENDWEWANIPSMMLNEVVNKMTADGTAAECVIVFPNATEYQGGYGNREGWRYEDYFFEELMPLVEKNFRVLADKGHRAVGGLSMGAGGTYQFALAHPELFSSAYAISGHCSQDVESFSEEKLAAVKTVNFVIDCGDDDIAFDNAVKSFQAFKRVGIPVQFRCRDGVHATFSWYDSFCLALQYFTRHFSDQCP